MGKRRRIPPPHRDPRPEDAPAEVRAALDRLGWQFVRVQRLGRETAYLVLTDQYLMEPYLGRTLIAMAEAA